MSRQGERYAQYLCPADRRYRFLSECEVEPCQWHLRRAEGVVKVFFYR